MRRLAIVVLSLAAVTLAASAVASAEETYTCVCTKDQCGKESGKGAEGKGGKTVTGVEERALKTRFGLEGPGRKGKTGWTCLAEGPYTCECKGKGDKGRCGGQNKDAVGTVREVDSAEKAIKWFKPEKVGKNSTGWVCKPGKKSSE